MEMKEGSEINRAKKGKSRGYDPGVGGLMNRVNGQIRIFTLKVQR